MREPKLGGKVDDVEMTRKQRMALRKWKTFAAVETKGKAVQQWLVTKANGECWPRIAAAESEASPAEYQRNRLQTWSK